MTHGKKPQSNSRSKQWLRSGGGLGKALRPIIIIGLALLALGWLLSLSGVSSLKGKTPAQSALPLRISEVQTDNTSTLFAADALTTLIQELLLPLVYCHIALASAGAALPESGLDKLADGLKKLISWLLCGAVTAFTLYLSVSGVLTGSADRAAVKAAQTAVSGAVPVVGSILAESAEMVLSAAHSLRAAIGAAGVLGVLLACLAPLVRLSVQFLLYRAAAFVSAVSGVKPLERLLEQLGDAFALVLGMTAACAALLLAALLVSISMVVM